MEEESLKNNFTTWVGVSYTVSGQQRAVGSLVTVCSVSWEAMPTVAGSMAWCDFYHQLFPATLSAIAHYIVSYSSKLPHDGYLQNPLFRGYPPAVA